jgi:hypothetical protein
MREWSRREWFHSVRLVVWLAQLPAVAIPVAQASVPYLVALSILTGVESGITDVDQTLADDARNRLRLGFHIARLTIWVAQLPLVLVAPALMESLAYLLALSLGAGIEGAITDVDQARADRKAGQ